MGTGLVRIDRLTDSHPTPELQAALSKVDPVGLKCPIRDLPFAQARPQSEKPGRFRGSRCDRRVWLRATARLSPSQRDLIAQTHSATKFHLESWSRCLTASVPSS
jgi:hypothetical protein